MNERELTKIIKSIPGLDLNMAEKAAARQAELAKPPGSLGVLESISIRMAGLTGSLKNHVDKGCVVVMCADNGVAEEGVASAPQSVTMAQTVNFTRRLTGVGALAESYGSELLIVDLGVKDAIPTELYDDVALRDTHKIVDRRIASGTGNIARRSAMTREQVLRCLEIGIEMADAVKAKGFHIIGVGEMGIGNTTTSAAVLSAVTGLDSEMTCGRGGGINDESFEIKKDIVDRVSDEYRRGGGLLKTAGLELGGMLSKAQGKPSARDAMIDVLAKMGGFDICAMAGVFIGAAKNKMPAVIDGYISLVAALAAAIIAPKSTGCMFASHKSNEKGYGAGIEALSGISEVVSNFGMEPFLGLNMRLGEGSGCPIAFDVIKGACHVMNNMGTFEEARIDDGYLYEIRNGDCF
ncbi:MAG: nicotinate-nucleotide--dimethylbenzimidazole phosphoribosyltransferase [Clostridiales bacterium]|nr:nicotinate-nucleotide--dimethylbenzimidazole phosphoribosyltransferase [Clostridiales bacterium]